MCSLQITIEKEHVICGAGQAVRGSPWLTLSSLGIGTYLGNEDPFTDEQVTCAIIMSVYHAM